MQFRSTVDLHSHSTVSDGELTPAELVDHAAALGVQTLALTDHDSIAGVAAALQAADRHGIELVPGVEISVTWERKTLHLVGLGIDPASPELSAGLDAIQRRRRHRAAAIAERIEALGVPDALARAQALADGGQITRTHFARVLIEAGRCKDMRRAFQRYLGQGKAAYVGTKWADLAEAVGWIRAAGGVAVIAHPHRYKLSRGARHRLLEEFRSHGGEGLEVCCGTSSPADIADSAEAASSFGLAGSVASDYHGSHQPWLQLGRVAPLPAGIDNICDRMTSRVAGDRLQ